MAVPGWPVVVVAVAVGVMAVLLVGSPSGRRACNEDTAIRAPSGIGLGARPWALAARCRGAARAAEPHPRRSGQLPPRRAAERADCRHGPRCWRRRSPTRAARDRARRRRADGLRRARVRRGRPRRRCAARPDRRPRAWACRCWPPPSSRWRSTRCSPGSSARPSRVVLGGRPSPYDVVRRFTATVAGQHPTRSCPSGWPGCSPTAPARSGPRCGWRSATGRCWRPPGRPSAGRPVTARRTRCARAAGRRCGTATRCSACWSCGSGPASPLTPVEERLFAGLADQAGLVLRGARLRAELELRLAELSARAEELRVSRERLVDAHDAERRRLERDIHDGAQQHLVALAVNLRLAATLAVRSPERADALLAEQERAGAEAIATLVRLSPRHLPAAARGRRRRRGAPPGRGGDGGRRSSCWRPTSADTRRRSRRRRTSAASRRSRTPPSTPRRRPSGSTLRRHRDDPEISVEDDGRGFDPGARPDRRRARQHPRAGRVRRRHAHRQLGARARHPDPRRARRARRSAGVSCRPRRLGAGLARRSCLVVARRRRVRPVGAALVRDRRRRARVPVHPRRGRSARP